MTSKQLNKKEIKAGARPKRPLRPETQAYSLYAKNVVQKPSLDSLPSCLGELAPIWPNDCSTCPAIAYCREMRSQWSEVSEG